MSSEIGDRLGLVLSSCVFSMLLGAGVGAGLDIEPLICHHLSHLAADLEADLSRDEMLLKLSRAEFEVLATSREDRVACLKWLADLHRDLGSYHAEELYTRAIAMAPENPELLEAAARYYRNHRGAKGLFAEAERYYLRAEAALEPALSAAEPSPWLLELRERIVRGRIELNKREGLGLALPGRPGRSFGVYLGQSFDDGAFGVAHNDLATPAQTLLNLDPNFDLRAMLREEDVVRRRTRLRFRSGSRPYWDVAWSSLEATEVIASQTVPVEFADLEVEEAELAVEDTMNLAPAVDFLWRAELRHGDFDVEGPARESFDRLTASTIFTRAFGRVKADLELLGSFSTIDLRPGDTDHDRLAAANLRFLHFRSPKSAERRLIDPRGYEYVAGYVTRNRQFGEDVELVQETFFVGVKLAEIATRTDLQILSNFFRNTVRGRAHEDSSNFELNVILVYRLLDLVNNMKIKQANRSLGLAQWSITARLFLDETPDPLNEFESRGIVLGSFVEIFSGPAHRSTVILEGAYEIRDYPRLDERQMLARFGLRLGF